MQASLASGVMSTLITNRLRAALEHPERRKKRKKNLAPEASHVTGRDGGNKCQIYASLSLSERNAGREAREIALY